MGSRTPSGVFTTRRSARWDTAVRVRTRNENSYAFAGIVALWSKAWSHDVWPAALKGRLPAAPDKKLMDQALSAARTLVGQVITRDSELRMIWERVGAKSNRQLQEDGRHCWIEDTATGFAIVPTHNGGNRGEQRGFIPLQDRAVRVGRDGSDSELGAGLRRAFGLCT
jgi:hypothetical protein